MCSHINRRTSHINSVCVMWPETVAGRGANEIASGVVLKVERIVSSYPDILEIITWLNLCVPKSQNTAMSYAMQDVLHQYPRLLKVQMKYCEPGHSNIQEVHTVHSQAAKKSIQKTLRIQLFK